MLVAAKAYAVCQSVLIVNLKKQNYIFAAGHHSELVLLVINVMAIFSSVRATSLCASSL